MLRLSIFLVFFVQSCAAVNLLRKPATNAEELYNQAMSDLNNGLYPEATAAFSDLKSRYPYSKFAILADLRIADTNFQRAKYTEAIDSYRNFLKYHPNHSEAGYAMYQIGESYYEQIPEDWWFMPPGKEKDQGNTRLAIVAYRDMIERFEKHTMAEQARNRLKECRSKLADHEVYVANFYLSRERYAGAVSRAEGVLRDYSGLGLDAKALWILARAQDAQGNGAAAKATAQKIIKDFPDTTEASSAQRFLSTPAGAGAPPARSSPHG